MKTLLIILVVWALLTWVCPTAIIRTKRLPKGINGIALAPFLVLVKKDANNTTVSHELIHVEQYKRYGWLGFYPIYFYYQWKYGYRKNPLEVEAYNRQ